MANAIAYEAYWRKNDGEWVYAGRTGGSSIEVSGIYAGRYVAKVRAINALDIGSLYSESVETVLNGKTTLPPTVAALTTESLVFAIKVKWQIPQGVSTADLQRTEIWYGKTADLAMATKLGDYAYPQTDLTMMGLAAGTSLFFWARLVDRTGNIGPWFPSGSGVNGQASSDASPILDLIAGQISETELGKHLLDRIELIDGSGAGSVNDRLDNTRKELQALVDQVTDALLYDAARAYASGEFVRQENHLYQAIQTVPANSPPPNAAYWLDIGSLVQTSNALALQIQQNKTAIETVDGKVTSTAQKTDGVYAQVNPKMAGDEQTSFAGDDVSMAGTWSVMSAIAEGDIAQAIKTDALEVRVNQNRASITSVDSASASRDEALAQRVTRLDAKVNNNSASIDTRLTTLATADKTLAQSIETVQTKVNQQSVSIQTNASAIADTNGKLAANWSVRMQVAAGGGYKFAGIGLGIENGPGGLQSQFLISADQFAIYNENTPGKPSTPFAVRGTETFIDSAFIQNGTITNAKIGQVIQSNDYQPGVRGWKLDKAGGLELNGVGGGGRMTISNQLVQVFDANQVLRVRFGIWG
ncbi:phage tail tip fiber protein [Pseudomonas sp. MF7453]|uniref:phage tail tip fiber protein n=1 Tax=Pseudomonas sp. MF7453 TaxID=2797539 RepID=UPI002FCD6CB0